ncbi:MAG: hypothetical protein WD904_03350 [Dehalococcoidia bacterium]
MTNERTSAWRFLFLLLSAFAMTALLLATACGGDDDDGGDETSATATQDSGDDGGDDGGDDEDPTETEDSGDDGGDEEDIFSQLDELTGDLETVTGKISYEITDADGTTSSMTFYAKSPNSRFDTSDGSTTSIIISTPDTTYVCDSSSETCIATPGSGDDVSSLGLFGAFFSSEIIGAYVNVAEAAGVDVEMSDESINGIDATCFSWDEDTALEVDSGKLCFNDAGVMVYQEFTDDSGTTKLEATEYSDDVSDSDFEPPYDVTEIPGQ